MKYNIYYHNHADAVIGTNQKFFSSFQEIISSIESMSDDDIVTEHLRVKQRRKGVKSLSEAINNILKTKLLEKSWRQEAAIFRDEPYSDSNNKKWRLDFAKDPISIEVAFNHGEAIAHNLLKPVLASQLNHVQKAIQTELAVIITATEQLKDKGNFDNAVGTYDKYIEYLKPYAIYMAVPVAIIGLCAPDTFFIDGESREIRKI